MPGDLAWPIASMAARSSTGPQCRPNCQLLFASGITSGPAAPSVTIRIASSPPIGVFVTWHQGSRLAG